MNFEQFLNEGSKPNVKLKKYKWNEPDPDKRTWDDSDYNNRQIGIISHGRGSLYKEYGNIDDLNPDQYNYYQMKMVSMGRGDDPFMGNIDDLDPQKYNDNQMGCVSQGRGADIKIQNIDDLDPNEYDEDKMLMIAKQRANLNDPKWLP